MDEARHTAWMRHITHTVMRGGGGGAHGLLGTVGGEQRAGLHSVQLRGAHLRLLPLAACARTRTHAHVSLRANSEK